MPVETPPTTTHSFLLDADLSEAFEETAKNLGMDIPGLIATSWAIGMAFVKSGKTGRTWYIREPGEELARVVWGEGPTISPARDATKIKKTLHDRYGIPFQFANQSLQENASSLVATITQKIKDRFGHKLTSEHHLILELISQGVLVTKDLTNILEPNYILRSPLPLFIRRFIDRFYLRKTTCKGTAISGDSFLAILLNADTVTNHTMPEGSIDHTAAHEIWHLLGENNTLPELLDEAGADIYAERTVDFPTNQLRLGKDFPLAFVIWHKLEELIGDDAVLQIFLEAPYIKQDVNLVTKTAGPKSFIDLPLHQKMRELLGQSSRRESNWDKVLELIRQEKLRKAHKLFFNSLK